MSNTIYYRDSEAVPLHNAASSLPTPTADAGGDISSARYGASSDRDGSLRITANGTGTITSPKLRGKDGSAWYDLGDLNDGATIDLTSGMGWSRPVFDVGQFDRLAIEGGVTGGIKVTVTYVPAEAHG